MRQKAGRAAPQNSASAIYRIDKPQTIASKDLGQLERSADADPEFPKIFSCSSLAWQANFASGRQCLQ